MSVTASQILNAPIEEIDSILGKQTKYKKPLHKYKRLIELYHEAGYLSNTEYKKALKDLEERGELIIYQYGNSNYNIYGYPFKYRHNANELQRVLFNASHIYLNSDPYIPQKHIYYIANRNTTGPIILRFFTSVAQLKEFLKNDPDGQNLVNTYGKLGDGLGMGTSLYTGRDKRAIEDNPHVIQFPPISVRER